MRNKEVTEKHRQEKRLAYFNGHCDSRIPLLELLEAYNDLEYMKQIAVDLGYRKYAEVMKFGDVQEAGELYQVS